MRIPAQLLKFVAGPMLASTALACTSPAPSPPTLAFSPPPPVTTAEAIDPVAYDESAEADRLERAEVLLASGELVRQQRVEAHEEAQRQRAALAAQRARREIYIMPACGRG